MSCCYNFVQNDMSCDFHFQVVHFICISSIHCERINEVVLTFFLPIFCNVTTCTSFALNFLKKCHYLILFDLLILVCPKIILAISKIPNFRVEFAAILHLPWVFRDQLLKINSDLDMNFHKLLFILFFHYFESANSNFHLFTYTTKNNEISNNTIVLDRECVAVPSLRLVELGFRGAPHKLEQLN